MKFTKKDFVFSVITGLITGIIFWQIALFLKMTPILGIPFVWLVWLVPLFWIIGINVGYFLGRRFNFFNQFGKFVAVGFTNAAVDFGALNALIALSGIAVGPLYGVFKTISFIFGICHSYVWNKFWVFNSRDSGQAGQEFAKFLTVGVISWAINVGVAYFIVNGIQPQFNLSVNAWANFGAVVGSASALIFSFVGFRLAVFRP